MRVNDVDITWLGNAGFRIKNNKTIYIDPYNVNTSEKADIILITHSHYDHCSIADIQKIVKDGTHIVLPADAQSKVTRLREKIVMEVLEAGDSLSIENVKIDAVPAYNINKEFHPKDEGWLGYVLKFHNVVLYHAGDTDLIPEMKKLTGYGKSENEFVAFLPIGGTYTMNVDEAVEAAKMIKPSIVVPMHYGSIAGKKEDAMMFKKKVEEAGGRVEVLEKGV